MAEFKISTSAFEQNGMIPVRFTCDGPDINPPFTVQGTPPAAKSLALIVDDPDAPSGLWVHWLVWNISSNVSEVKENAVPQGAVQGINDFRKHTYGGPCPPSGTHRYYFKLYALDVTLDIGNHSKKQDLEKAMKGHILAEAQIMGRYSRR